MTPKFNQKTALGASLSAVFSLTEYRLDETKLAIGKKIEPRPSLH